jgi:nitrite reductase (cytochrome c-552)
MTGRRLLIVTALSAVAAVAIFAVLVTIFQHKQEARNPFFRVVELNEETVDPAVWGRNFPSQYDGYRRTVDQVRTRFGGSEAVPRTPTAVDPRSVVAQSRLDEDPRLKTIWAGYAFSKDFREERGHAYMLEDQVYTERQQVTKQPGTCLHCHASVYEPYRKAGGGDLFKGFEALNKMPYAEARGHVKFPVACVDCHDPTSMALRVTRPAFMEGIKAAKAADGVANYDVNTMATRQEMRAFVCGQCHVEYYFKGPEKRLTYPWLKGLKADQILAYYEENGFKDWTHADSGAPVLKAQHPEFELWSQGIHARSGVACADCHMPYKREGAMKVSDHWVRSPLLDVSRACQVCHPYAESEIRARVAAIQDRTQALLQRAAGAAIDMLDAIGAAKKSGAPDDRLAPALALQRRAQWRLDFVAAENSMGFHAPAEAARILAESIDFARQAQLAARAAVPSAAAAR